MILASGDRRGKGWEGKGLEVPPRGSSFNTRTGLCCGVGRCRRCRSRTARSRRQALLPPVRVVPVCVCVCQAVPVLPVRTSCEPVAFPPQPSSQRGLQGRLEQGGTQPPPGPPRWSPVRSLCCVCAGCGCRGACPSHPAGTRGICVCVSVCLCTRVLFNVYISTIYTLWSWSPYISSIPCLGQQ